MILKNEKKIKNNLIAIGLIFFIVGEMVFYRLETKNIYLFFNLFGILIMGLTLKIKFNKRDNFIVWFTFINLIFSFYGLFFLKKGVYNYDIEIFHYVIILYSYIGIYKLLKNKDFYTFFNVFIYSFIFVLFFLLIREGHLLFSPNKQITFGNTIAGNRNTTAFFLGIELTIFLYGYFITHKKKFLFLVFLSNVCILLTGSKKGIIMILINGLFYFIQNRKSKKNIIFFILLIFIFFYLVFFNEYFYNIIGVRLKNMVFTFRESNSMYSRSTSDREFMIKEGWNIFLENPILGGGYNNFFYNTKTRYDYSHCNYIELLCSFGIVGTILYYSQHLKILFYVLKKRLKKKFSSESYLILNLCTQILILDFSLVSFYGMFIFYLPIMLASILNQNIKEKKINV